MESRFLGSSFVKRMYCANCGTVDRPKLHTPGSFFIEVLLWLCLVVPGMIYTVWRHTARKEVCRACFTPNLLPLDSPKARNELSKTGRTRSD